MLPPIEEDSLLNLEMLDVAEKDPVAPTPASAPSSPTPDPEKQVIQIPEESCTSEPEEAAHLEGGLDLIWARYPARPPGFVCFAGKSNPCRFSERYTPRRATRHLLSGVTTGNHIPWPSGQGGAL